MLELQKVFPDTDGTKRPAIWTDNNGITHRAVGAEVVKGERLLWTSCEQKDVPANAAKICRLDEVDCPACRKVWESE